MVRCSLCRSTNHNRRNCHQDIQPERGLRDSDNENITSQSSLTESSTTGSSTSDTNISETSFHGFSESSFAGFSDHNDNAEHFNDEYDISSAKNGSLSAGMSNQIIE